MAYKIAQARGVDVSKQKSQELILELLGVVGLGFAAQQLVLTLYKIGLPGLGGLMTIPMVYGLTFAIGKVVDRYFLHVAQGKQVDTAQLRALFTKIFKEMTAWAKENQDVIQNDIKERNDDVKRAAENARRKGASGDKESG
jgi:uncharacterized protein (DUF697 family)